MTPPANSRRSGPSVYENRFISRDRQDHEDVWVRVAEPNMATGKLQWRHGWERRVQGWRPLEEVFRGRKDPSMR
jgi:hypothetical protein